MLQWQRWPSASLGGTKTRPSQRGRRPKDRSNRKKRLPRHQNIPRGVRLHMPRLLRPRNLPVQPKRHQVSSGPRKFPVTGAATWRDTPDSIPPDKTSFSNINDLPQPDRFVAIGHKNYDSTDGNQKSSAAKGNHQPDTNHKATTAIRSSASQPRDVVCTLTQGHRPRWPNLYNV